MEVTRDTPLTVAYVTWQFAPPETRIVVIVKATYAIVADAPCVLAEEQHLVTGDTPHDDDETQSVRIPTDVVPFKPRGECFLAGTCHPPGGRATISAVGVRIGAAHRELAVFGDREWSSRLSAGVPKPKPFTSMPLRWERAFGGRGHDRNPYGRGLGDVTTPDGESSRPLPNIEDPRELIESSSSRPRPAGTFPMPHEWRAKESRMGTYDRAYMRERWPYLPADFDYEYFLSAPRELRIEGFFKGDEEIELTNLHPEHAQLRTRLPGLRPRAFLSHAGAPVSRFEEVPLRLDTITVDADAMRVICVWRGAVPVASEKLTDIERLFVAQEPYGVDRALSVYAERLAEVLRARDAELAEAEGIDPPSADDPITPPASDDAVVAVVAPPPPDDPVAKALADLDAKLADLGVIVAPPATEPAETLTPEKLAEIKAAMEAGGIRPPAELDALLAMLTDPPAPRVTDPGEPPRRDGRTLLAQLRAGQPVADQDWSGVDLSNQDLTGLDFSYGIFTHARFAQADLSNAKLVGTQLSGSDLSGATCRGTSFVSADLDHAKLVRADLGDACFDEAWMEGATLTGSHLPRASLKKAWIAGADLERCHAVGAILDGADLTGARLVDADLRSASLIDTTLEAVNADRATFEDADLTNLRASEGASFEDVSFKNARAPGARFQLAKLHRANFSFVDLTRADFTGASLVQALLHACSARSSVFREAKLVGALANKADFFEATFESADLAHADLRGSSFFGAQLWKARTEGTRFELADLTRATVPT